MKILDQKQKEILVRTSEASSLVGMPVLINEVITEQDFRTDVYKDTIDSLVDLGLIGKNENQHNHDTVIWLTNAGYEYLKSSNPLASIVPPEVVTLSEDRGLVHDAVIVDEAATIYTPYQIEKMMRLRCPQYKQALMSQSKSGDLAREIQKFLRDQ